MQSAAAPVKPPKRPTRRRPSNGSDAVSTPDVSWVRVSPSPAQFETDSPGAEALATECAINLLHVRDLLWTRFDRLMRAQAIPSASGFVILSILAGASSPLSPQVIAQRMFLTPGTITGLITTLQKHGFVTTAKGVGRGRHMLISITDAGRRIQHQAVRELDPRVVGWLACFDTPEKLSLLRLLGTLGMHLQTLPNT